MSWRRFEGLNEVLGMAVPIIVGTFSYTAMHFVDSIMVARLSKEAFAAIGSAGVWVFTLSTFFLGVVGCVSTFVSQSLGRGEKADCARYAWQGIYLSLGTGLVAIVLWPSAEVLFRSMHHEAGVVRLEVTYFQVRLLGYAFMAWQATLAAFFQAVSRPVIPMLAAFVANLANALLAYVLIFGKFGFPRLEIAGAAWATNIALLLQVALLQAVFFSKSVNDSFGTRRGWPLDWVKLRELLRIGWPAGLSFLLDLLNWAIFTSFIVGYFGTVHLAANNAVMALIHVSFMPAVGLNHAIAPIVGQWIGRGGIPTAKARTYTAMRLAIVYMVSVGISLAAFGPLLIRLFYTSDPDIVRLGHILLILAATFQAFDAINIVASGALRGAGDTRFLLRVTITVGYLFFLPLATALAFWGHWGAVGAWLGVIAYVVVLSVFLWSRFHYEGWRHIRIFEKDRLIA